ncbi:MAG: hypothetical protein MI754_08405 [Chromatiales bacterium]|nr:hypothetical protein [Chromatiales bacterium]
MCVAIYLVLIGLAFLYSDALIESLVLSQAADGQSAVAMALGWEIVPVLWPLFLLAMVVASAGTLFVSRRLACPRVK